jgi:uncharacterized protein YacL
VGASSRSGQVVTELLRLGIVLLFTAGGYALGDVIDGWFELGETETTRLLTSVLGALFGYLLGGALGRAVVRSVDTATVRLQRVPAAQLVSSGIGAAGGSLVAVAVMLPVLLLPYQRYTVPITLLIVLVLAYAGGRLGASRGPELGRFIGMRGRLEVGTPSRGRGVKLLDSSALIDGRIIDVARAGFLEGTLVVPTFVLEEVQGLADAGEAHRRKLGQRGLATVQVLQDEGVVAVEISDEDVPTVVEVDSKLATLCRVRQAALVTCDGNLARVAEIGGIRVLNLHVLADAVRPPVLPGERLPLRVVRPGREPAQGVGYLDDGTMVVIDKAAHAVGTTIEVDVTSIVQNRRGRMLFGVPAGASAPVPPPAAPAASAAPAGTGSTPDERS